MKDSLRIVGYAGSGKTTRLLSGMEKALHRLGNDPMLLGFASFTRPARQEAVDRASAAWGFPAKELASDGWFRTIHSTAYRCCGIQKGEMLGSSKGDLEWLSNTLGASISAEIDDVSGGMKFSGDSECAKALNCWNVARNMLLPLEATYITRFARGERGFPSIEKVTSIVEKYESGKRIDGRIDFSDLLMRFAGLGASITEGSYHREPEGYLPEVVFWILDEMQDVSPLLDRVCHRLISAPSVKWIVLAGDPNQSIFRFAGSSADCFMAWPVSREEYMEKTYRCPAPVLAVGEKCLSLLKAGKIERKMQPADHDGSLDRASSLDEMVAAIGTGEDWLLLGRTNFQVSRICNELDRCSIPYRWASASDTGPTKKARGLRAIYDLARGNPVSGKSFAEAVSLLPEKNRDGQRMLKRGTKTEWKSEEMAKSYDVVFPHDLEYLGFSDDLRQQLTRGDWPQLVDGGGKWHRIVDRHGVEAATLPTVRVGTVHSAKGMEADSVGVLTTTSERIDSGMDDPGRHDEECRLAYVAATRARRRLVLLNERGGSICRMPGLD